MRRTVHDVMTRDVVAVRGATPFKELVRLLNEHRITALPVLDDTGRVVVGVVSETDLALKEVAPLREAHTPVFETAEHRGERAKAASLTAADLMTAPAVTAGPDERSQRPPGACMTAPSSGCRWSTAAARWSGS
jgi:CBS-domain-containing membrane protein